MEIIRIVYPKSVHYSLMGFGATVLLLSHYTTKDVLDLAPNLYALVPKRRASRRKVMDALVDENLGSRHSRRNFFGSLVGIFGSLGYFDRGGVTGRKLG